ncbi:MAG: phosphate ABC transporter permease, partial [Chlorobium sp.]
MAGESVGESNRSNAFVVSARKRTLQKVAKIAGESVLFSVAAFVALIVLFIFYFVTRDAVPFFQLRGFSEFFTSSNWYPADEPGEFGALAIIYGSLMVTLGSAIIAVPMGVAAAIC